MCLDGLLRRPVSFVYEGCVVSSFPLHLHTRLDLPSIQIIILQSCTLGGTVCDRVDPLLSGGNDTGVKFGFIKISVARNKIFFRRF